MSTGETNTLFTVCYSHSIVINGLCVWCFASLVSDCFKYASVSARVNLMHPRALDSRRLCQQWGVFCQAGLVSDCFEYASASARVKSCLGDRLFGRFYRDYFARSLANWVSASFCSFASSLL